MDNEQKEKLAGIFSHVLETLAFMFSEVVEPEEMGEAEDGAMLAHMRFSGPFSGELALAASRDMCAELAANVLGMEPGDEMAMERAADSVKELLNVTCGNYLTAVAGEEPVFDLSIPEARDIGGPAWNKLLGDDNAVCFLVDDYPAILWLGVHT